jgi:hypothetical protein
LVGGASEKSLGARPYFDDDLAKVTRCDVGRHPCELPDYIQSHFFAPET